MCTPRQNDDGMDPERFRLDCISTAAYLCQHGIRVTHATFRTKSPKHKAWNETATNNIQQFVQGLPAGLFNMGMVFGPTSGVLDIEPDSPEAYIDIEALMKANGVKTLSYRSRRGLHRIFKWDDRLSHLGTANPKTVNKLECRLGSATSSFFSVCPPSVHPDTGEHYEWVPGCAPWEIAPAELPQNVVDHFLANVSKAGSNDRTHDLIADDDGYMPGEGGRHDYLLSFSKSMYCDWMLPKDLAEDVTRMVSQRTGSYDEPGRGEVELKNLFKGLQRPSDPVKEMQASISMSTVNDLSEVIFEKYREEHKDPLADIPDHIFHPVIQKASLSARGSQMPRNLWLMSIMTAAASALGTACMSRVSPNHPVTGNQIYSFGVGGSGSGKSKTLAAVNAPFAGSEYVMTDATPEALISSLARIPRGVMLEFSEGRDFAKMLGRYNSVQGQTDNSLYHRAWSGDRTRVQRQKGACWVERPHLVVSAAIQRNNLNLLPQNDLVDGLGQRIVVYPVGKIPKKANNDALAEHAAFMELWCEVLNRLQEVKSNLGMVPMEDMLAGRNIVTKPLINTLDAEAKALWDEYAAYKRSDQLEARWPDDEHPFRSDLVRHAEQALRFANVIWMLDCAIDREFWYHWGIAQQDYGFIPKGVMQRAIDLQEFLWTHKQRYLEPLVEAAFAAVSGGHLLDKSESVPKKLSKFVAERKRRVERSAGETWTLRDYYNTLGIRKNDGQLELDLFIREGHVASVGVLEGKNAERFKFLEMIGE